MFKRIILSIIILILGAGVAFFVFKTEPKLNKNFEAQKSFFQKFPFRMGLGGKVGSGHQYMSWISLDDLMEVFMFALKTLFLRHGKIEIFPLV